MDRSVPDRGTDDEGNGQVNEGRSTYVAGFAPVKARMGYEDADATRKQGEYAQHGNPMRDADDQETTWRLSSLTHEFADTGLVTHLAPPEASMIADTECYLIADGLALGISIVINNLSR
jgi:hypothetical protein